VIELGGATVAITGAGRGIGKATARAFLDRGAKVAIGDLDLAVAKAAATELATGRGDSVAAVGFGMDVADPVAFEVFLDEVEGQLALHASIWLNNLLPARVNDAIMKLYRADTVFLDIDVEQRKAYDHRIQEPANDRHNRPGPT
jgi:NAD(P)-dependent dehydrogenase (short-subunit alcohol dehydrogenase family)